MTKDEIIRMAKEAGLGATHTYKNKSTYSIKTIDNLERFAKLVAAAEREACAVVCEELELPDWPEKVRQPLAEAIRARSQS